MIDPNETYFHSLHLSREIPLGLILLFIGWVIGFARTIILMYLYNKHYVPLWLLKIFFIRHSLIKSNPEKENFMIKFLKANWGFVLLAVLSLAFAMAALWQANHFPLRFQPKRILLHTYGDTYDNPSLELIISINKIDNTVGGKGVIGFKITTGQETRTQEKLEPGNFWDFNHNGKKYRVVFLEIVTDGIIEYGVTAAHFELSYLGKQ